MWLRLVSQFIKHDVYINLLRMILELMSRKFDTSKIPNQGFISCRIVKPSEYSYTFGNLFLNENFAFSVSRELAYF